MLITPGQTFFGVSAKLLQFAAAELYEDFDLERLCWELGAPPSEVQPVLDQMVAAGWVTRAPEKAGRFVEAKPWSQLRMARTGKPLPRAKADVLMAEMLERVKASNRSPSEDIALITGVYLFGSYLNPAKNELGDVDVAFSFAYPKNPDPSRGLSLRKMFGRDKATANILKNRSPHLSVCDIYALDQLGCERCEIYSVKDDSELWSPAYATAQVYPDIHQKVLAGEPLYTPI
jgi:hypothetical protein